LRTSADGGVPICACVSAVIAQRTVAQATRRVIVIHSF